jgi:septum formation protein
MVLASASPRRRELLAQAGYVFTVCPAEIDESDFMAEGINPRQYAQTLALAKARSVAPKFPQRVVIAADTVVDFQGRVIGKPADAKDAEQITRKLFGEHHKVISAVAIVRLTDNTRIVDSDSTTVYPKKMSDEQIAEHIKSGRWRDKAGAYAIQEGGDEFIERIEGSLTNVCGLPMELLHTLFARITD